MSGSVRRHLALAAGIVAGMALLGVGAAGLYWLLAPARFPVTEVEVRGELRHTAAADIRAALPRSGNFFAVDLGAAQPEALGPALEVRRGERPHAAPGREQDRLAHQRRAALALRARDVDCGQPALGVVHALEQRADRCEREAPVREVRAPLHVDQAAEPSGGFLDVGVRSPSRHRLPQNETRRPEPPRGIRSGARPYWTM